MIGDHMQLPPFGVEQIIPLLEAPEKLTETLGIGEEFIGWSLRDTTTEEILDELEEGNSDFPGLCAEALRLLTFFENTIEVEFGRQAKSSALRPIAKKLTAQHRMHPEIAALVSRCFYKGELVTHPERAQAFQQDSAPFTSLDNARLPSKPIVVVDVPYIQATVGQQRGDQYPRWHNPMEVDAVVEMASLLAAREGQAPTLAILSPYAQQVRRMHGAIGDAAGSRLSTLAGFRPPSQRGTWCHTVDSFQGGEADAVIVSLVRNNEHSNVQNALGFLTDRRRMNVLLSRARWQLILVTSMDFLQEIVAAARTGPDAGRIDFIAEMLLALRDGIARGVVARIPFSTLEAGRK
jgi:hypothetical protein